MKRLILSGLLVVQLAAPAWAGFNEGLAAYKRGDYATALSEWRASAQEGHAAAQYDLGLMYYLGEGVEADPTLAYFWFSLALSDQDIPASARAKATNDRRVVANKMTSAQIAEAERLAREWKPK